MLRLLVICFVSQSPYRRIVWWSLWYIDGDFFNSGHVRVYEWTSNNQWIQRGSDIDGEASGGSSVRSGVALLSDGDMELLEVPAVSEYRLTGRAYIPLAVTSYLIAIAINPVWLMFLSYFSLVRGPDLVYVGSFVSVFTVESSNSELGGIGNE